MPRHARQLADDACYHVLTRGNNRAAVFHAPEDFQDYGRLLLRFFREYGVSLYHYCFMTNHTHLLVRTHTGQGLRQAIQRVNLRYALTYKERYPHVGHLWQDRFRSLQVANESYLLQCGGYIDLNPVRAQMVAEPGAYPWSSARAYLTGQEDPLIHPSPVYLALGSTPAHRQREYRAYLARQLQSAASGAAVPLTTGSDPTWRELLSISGLEGMARPRGRQVKGIDNLIGDGSICWQSGGTTANK